MEQTNSLFYEENNKPTISYSTGNCRKYSNNYTLVAQVKQTKIHGWLVIGFLIGITSLVLSF